jgi:hypothetical protein
MKKIKCNKFLCFQKIDKSVNQVCGAMRKEGYLGCGKYFCGSHLYFCYTRDKEEIYLCKQCKERLTESKEILDDYEQIEFIKKKYENQEDKYGIHYRKRI